HQQAGHMAAPTSSAKPFKSLDSTEPSTHGTERTILPRLQVIRCTPDNRQRIFNVGFHWIFVCFRGRNRLVSQQAVRTRVEPDRTNALIVLMATRRLTPPPVSSAANVPYVDEGHFVEFLPQP
ncbi:MAG: hypothetical protein OER56_08000, partial [Hyphomicrobiales bacterium]|nr:hypothetical protein [Hyphomicrobiales bacterium]